MSSSSIKDEENKDETDSIQSFYNLALTSKTEKDILSFTIFFENYSFSSCKKLAEFAVSQINSHNLLSIEGLEQNQHELSLVLKLLSVCILTTQRISSVFFNPNESSNFLFLQIISLLSKVSMETDESINCLNSLLEFLASSIWDSKAIAKYSLSKLSSIKRENNQSLLHFLTSLTQVKAESTTKGISSFILLELLQFLSNTKVASANLLKNNVDRYSKLLNSKNDLTLFSKFIQHSFKKIKSSISKLNLNQNSKVSQDNDQNQNSKADQDKNQNQNVSTTQNQNTNTIQNQNDQSNPSKEPVYVELSKLQKQFDKVNSEYSLIKENLQKKLEKMPAQDPDKNPNDEDVQTYKQLLTQAQKTIQYMKKANDELAKNKLNLDSIVNRQLEILRHENLELRNQLNYDEESLNMKRQMESNQIENERLTKKLEHMKQLNNEIKLNTEIDKLKAELRSSNIQLTDLQEEVTKLKHENQSLSMKENEYINYRNKLLDTKIELISLRKENKRLEEEIKKLQSNQKEGNDKQTIQKSSKPSENSEPSQNLSDKKLLEAKLQIESLKQQISEKDMLNARLKATQLSMTTANQAEITDLKNQLSEATKQINLLKSLKIELTVQIDTLKQKLTDSLTSNKKLISKNSESKSASFSGTLPNNSFLNSDEYDEAPKLRSQIFSLSNELEKLKKANQPVLELDDARKEILSLRNQISELKNLSQTGNFRNKKQNEAKPADENNVNYEEQNKLLQNEIREKEMQISDLLAQIQDLQSSKTKNEIDNSIVKENTINELKNKIGEHENELNSLRSQLSDKEAEIAVLKKKFNINDGQKTDETKNSDLENKLIEKEKIITELQEKLNSIQSNNNISEQNHQNDIAQLTSQIAERDAQIKKKDKENKSLKSLIEDMKSSISERSPQTEKADPESEPPKSSNKDPQMEKLVKEIAKLRKSKTKLQQQVDDLTQSDSLKESQISTLRGQITIFQQFQITEAKKDAELIRLQSQLDDIQAGEEEKEKQIQSKLTEKDNEINNLKEQIEKLKSEQKSNNTNNPKIENKNNPTDVNENKNSEENKTSDDKENENNNENKENEIKNENKNSNDNQSKDENQENNSNKDKDTNNGNNNKEKNDNDGKKNEKNNKEKIDNDAKNNQQNDKKDEKSNQNDETIKRLLAEKEKIISSYESQIDSFQTQITELENKILDYDNGKKQTYDTQLKMLEIDKLNDELFLKDAEIDSLKNSLNRQQKQIEDLEKIQYLYTSNSVNSNSSVYDIYNGSTNNNDNDLQLYQKNQEISQLKLQISEQQNKINELKLELKSNNFNSLYDFTDYDSQGKVSNTDYLNLKSKCERLERELKQKKTDEQIEAQNMMRLKNELSSYQIKYNQLKDGPQSDSLLYQTLKEEYNQLESKHQVALKLIGKLWSRNQTLIRENGGKNSFYMNDNDDDFTPDDFQFL